METKLIALFLIALIGGLGGGFGLSYVIYEPRIQNLQNELNKSWHEAYSIEASSDITTGTIQLKGSSVRVMWTATSEYSTGWVSFILHFSNATPFGIWASSGRKTANNAVLELSQTGNYYLEITAYQTDYYVSVWDYY